jgi:hypothetical protein
MNGRYLSPEPLLQSPAYVRRMAQTGMSVPTYTYALNNPLRYVDRNGLDPGTPFATADLAAPDAATWTRSQHPYDSYMHEYGTVLYEIPSGPNKGQITYLPLVTQHQNCQVQLPDACPGKRVADWHSHPRWRTDPVCRGQMRHPGKPSPPDYRRAASTATDSYVLGPNDRLGVFDVYDGWVPGDFGGDWSMAGEWRWVP